MKATVYCSYGVLAHEKKNYYSVHAPASAVFDMVEITIPDNIVSGKNAHDEIVLTLDNMKYTLSEVLTNAGDAPALRWYDGRNYKTIKV